MSKPIIGITAGYSDAEDRHFLADYYTAAIAALGGIPLIIPSESPSIASDYYNIIDGLIFSGGGDLSPHYFSEEPYRGIGEISPRRDSFEWEMAKLALAREKPILAICRGMQLINIASGGSIYQDIGELTKYEHNQKAPRDYPFHSVRILDDSKLHQILARESILVNSFHHQAVKIIGKGLRPVAWSEDNIIEALEGENNKKIIAVQWHPECLWKRDKASEAIFKHFLDFI